MSPDPSDTNRQDGMLDLPLRPGGAAVPELPLDTDRLRPETATGPSPPPRRRSRRRRPSGRRLALIAGVLLAVLVVGYLLFWPKPPQAAFSPDPFQPSRVRVGATGEPDTLTIINVGERPMPVELVTLTGIHAEEYSLVEESCGARTLAPQDRCSVQLQFSPKAMGFREAVVEVHGDLSDSPARQVLSGEGIAPILTVTPPGLRFGAQDVGATSPSADLIVANEGTAPLEVSRVVLGGPGERDFRLTLNRCSRTTLDPGETCDLRMTFAPRAAGDRTAELEFRSDALDPVPTVSLAGEGIWTGAAFAVDPKSVDFGRHLVGTERLQKRVLVTNRQSATLRGLKVSLADGAAGFSVNGQDCTGRALAPGESCRVELGFDAKAEGAVSTLLQIGHPEVGTLGVEVSGTGAAPRWVVSTELLEFAQVRVELAGELQRLELRNEGSAAARITKTEMVGEEGVAFGVANDGCSGNEIGPGSGCALAVGFSPKREGKHRAELQLHASAGTSPQRVALVGTAIAPRLSLNREIVDFGRIHRTMLERVELTVSNRGTAPLDLGALGVADNPTGDFKLLGGSCLPTSILPPGGRCTVMIGFDPTIEGRFTARLQIDHDGFSGPRELPLAGVGLPPPIPELTLTISELDFGPQPVGERSTIQTVTIRAGGTGRLEFREFSIEGPNSSDFLIVPATCDAVPSLLPGTDCGVGVRFVPTAAGPRRARLVVRHNAGLGTSTVELLGDGLGGSPSG